MQGPSECFPAFAAADKEGIIHFSSRYGSNDGHYGIGMLSATHMTEKPGNLLYIGYYLFLPQSGEAAKAGVAISLHKGMIEN